MQHEPLTLLSAKDEFGERLYPLIFHSQPELAGRITGMLLELDNSALLGLLASPEALQMKVAEALEVLRAATSLHNAARYGDATTIRRVLESGVAPDTTGEIAAYRRTPLHHLCLSRSACMNGDRAACFKLLREAGANLEATDYLRNTPLHAAAANGFPELVSLLIQSGVNVNVASYIGHTPLHEAIPTAQRYAGSAADCVDLLIKAGAAVNVRSQDGWTPLDIAINRRHYRMWPLLLRAGAEFVKNHGPVCYFVRVRNAGGFKRYEQAHLARITAILETPLLPPELVRKILEFWLHAGYY